jgi:hypothetical protein
MPPGLAREVFRKPCLLRGGQGAHFFIIQVKPDLKACESYDKIRLKIGHEEATVLYNESSD